MRAVGYRQVWAHLEGERTLEETAAAACAATRQLAKRQLTWLRSQTLAASVDPLERNAFAAIQSIIGWRMA
jgi:tRNA dimethylallyltransferase